MQGHKKLVEMHLITTSSILHCIIGNIPWWISEIKLVPYELETSKEIIDRLARVLPNLILFNQKLIFPSAMWGGISFGKHIPSSMSIIKISQQIRNGWDGGIA
jgi:hypothetical protein